ncbi:MAG: Ig-like domain-containing protein [Archangium sp.]|nr:Ig-like domain-containing protein [Archangium sp.]MDP3156818.1 Ig-like domain-containing protein [Archangium sp.]MDP3569666.1 Ig-like domain-containing protein [Archangium sp.]
MTRLLGLLLVSSLFACVPDGIPSVDAGSGGGGGGRIDSGTGGGGGGGNTTTGGGGGTVSDDTTPPELLTTTPLTGSTDVAVGQPLQLIFSEPMNAASLRLTSAPANVLGGFNPNASNTLFTVPHAAFSFATSYTLTLEGTDVAGNALAPTTITFTTQAAPDTIAPTLLRSLPPQGAVDVSLGTPVLLTFSEPIDRTSIQLTSTPTLILSAPSFGSNDAEVSYNATNPLTPNTTYTLTVRASDVSGNPLASVTVSFTTAAPADVVAPTLISSAPADAATNVATTTRLSLTFSEAMSQDSVSVTLSPAYDLGEPTWSNQDRTVTFSAPPAALTDSRAYAVTVEGDDVAGNALASTRFTFTTAAPLDITRPRVASSSPAAGAMNVPTTSNLEFNFSERMNEAATEAALISSPALASRVITWNSAGTLMSVNPGVDFAFNTNITVTLGTGARDLAGNQLLAAHTFTFRTATAPDTTRPTVISTSPLNAAVGVSFASPITVTFSEPMRQAAAQAAFQITSPTGFNGGTFSWNAASTVMTYDPPDAFAQGTQVSFQVTTAAEDLAGNAMAATVSRSFRVRRIATTSFFASGTTDGASFDPRAGYIRSNASCSSASLNTGTSALAGDSEQGFITFNLAALAQLDNVVIRLALVNIEQRVCASTLGGASFDSDISLSHVDYGATLTLADCNTPRLSTVVFSTSATAGPRTRLVTSSVRDDFANRVARGNRSQWSLHTTRTGGPNFCVFATQNDSSKHPFLRVTYEFD